MKEESQSSSRIQAHTRNVSLARVVAVGLIGSLSGTAVMDLVMVVEFSLVGLPAATYLALIGSILGGGVPLGVVLHLLMGSLLGLGFSAGVLGFDVLPIETARKGVGLGVLAGIASISLCVPFAILAGTPVATLLRFSTIPHLVWGAVLGLIAGYGMRAASVARHKGNQAGR